MSLLTIADTFDWHHGDTGVGWWILMMLGMVIFWGLVIYGVVWLVRGAASPAPRETPAEILQRRLARGEISVEEYERRRALLEADAEGTQHRMERPG